MYIREIEHFKDFIQHAPSLQDTTLQNIDFSDLNISWRSLRIENTYFLGCQFRHEDVIVLTELGANVLTAPTNLPYQPFRSSLYSWQELNEVASRDSSVDLDIHMHFEKTKHNPSINEALWQRIHDHAIDDALRDLLQPVHEYKFKRKCVGMMGGHNTPRNGQDYLQVAQTAYHLSKKGYFIVSGGGPGIMEAANLGAYLSGYNIDSIYRACEMLSVAPTFDLEEYNEAALSVLREFPNAKESLAIPTWFYGHEPSNVFATHIAKYFSNSIREDTLLAICLHGVIFAPGSAGTTQEIFMDAAQNHYGTYGYYSPMIFLGKKHYERDTMLFPLLKQLAWQKPYEKLLFVSDSPVELSEWIEKHPPVAVN